MFIASWAVCILYWPGMYGPFLLDDYWNLEALGAGISSVDEALHFVFNNQSGPLGRPVAMFSFLANDFAWPATPFPFKLTNLLLHVICGLLILALSIRLFILGGYGSRNAVFLALFVSVLWLVHPFNNSTVLYVIQRMTQLATMFSLMAMWIFIIARTRIDLGQRYGIPLLLLGALPCVALSVLSKESGALTFVFLILIEYWFFSLAGSSAAYKRCFYSLIVLPVVALFVYLVYKNWDLAAVYMRRDFTFDERVLTQGRVMVDYIANIIAPRSAGSGLIHDDFKLSTSLFSPISTLWSWLLVSGLLIGAIWAKKRFAVLSFGIMFYFAGHLLESTALPLEIYFEHRNYLPMLGCLLIIAALLQMLLNFEERRLGTAAACLVAFVLIGVSGMLTSQNSRIWSNTFDLLTFWATEHPDSQRIQRVYGQFLGKTDWYVEGLDVLQDAYVKFPADIGLPLAALNLTCRHELEDVPYSADEIISNIPQARFNGGLVTIAKNFGELYLTGKCANQIEQGKADQIMLMLTRLPGFTKGAKADLLYFHAESKASRGDLNGAMSLMDEAFKNQRSLVVPFRQAQYLASAGLYDEALEYLDVAYELDANRKKPWATTSEKDNLDRLKLHILRKQNDEK